MSASILIVEDETLIAMDLESLLGDAGYRILGPVSSVDAALAVLEREQPDLALLDVNLGGEKVFPVATMLAVARTPFIFLSGHSAAHLPAEHQKRPLLTKPCLPTTVLDAVRRVLQARPAAQAVGG